MGDGYTGTFLLRYSRPQTRKGEVRPYLSREHLKPSPEEAWMESMVWRAVGRRRAELGVSQALRSD